MASRRERLGGAAAVQPAWPPLETPVKLCFDSFSSGALPIQPSPAAAVEPDRSAMAPAVRIEAQSAFRYTNQIFKFWDLRQAGSAPSLRPERVAPSTAGGWCTQWVSAS